MRLFTKVALASLAVVFFTACGGGGSSSGGGETTPPDETKTLMGIQVSKPINEPGFGVGAEEQFYASASYETCSGNNCTPLYPVDITNISRWESLDETVATVHNGLVKAISVGETMIEVSYEGFVSEIMIKVEEAQVNKIVITPSEKTINIGESFTFAVKGIMSDGTEVPINASWQTSNDAIAERDHGSSVQGTFIGVAQGTVTISASWGHVDYDKRGKSTLIVK